MLHERMIPSNTDVATLRRVPLTLRDATDLLTPENIDPTGVKPVVYRVGSGLGFVAATNDLVEIDGALGAYDVVLERAEVNFPPGTMLLGTVQPAGCARAWFKVVIGQESLLAEPETKEEIADATARVIAGAVEAADGSTTSIPFNSGTEVWARTPSSVTSRTRQLTPP